MKAYRTVAQEHPWGGGAACVASVLGVGYREIAGQLAGRKAPSMAVLRGLLNRALADSGLAYEIDGPFIGDPDGLETGSIVALAEGRTLMRAANGWMDPATGRVRPRLPGPVRQALVMTPGRGEPIKRRRKTARR
ncbi:MAG TPA: hypothetical protein VI456_16600 [Polyangia bacterium]